MGIGKSSAEESQEITLLIRRAHTYIEKSHAEVFPVPSGSVPIGGGRGLARIISTSAVGRGPGMKLKFLIGPSFLLDLETGFHHVMSPPSSSSVRAGHKLGNRRVTNYDGLPEKKRFPVGDGSGGGGMTQDSRC